MGGMASAAAEDIKIGLGRMEPTDGYNRRTEQRKAREREAEAARAFGDDDKPAPPRAQLLVQRAAATNMAPVEAAPTIPDPNAIGETEQALLDAQSRGRSSTIQTSARGLLSGEDDTRKKRSLMGGLIT